MAGINEVFGGLFGSGGTVDVQKYVGPVLDLVQNSGGVKGVVSQLQNAGLGEQVSSWVGTGENAKVDPSKLTSALGPEKVQAMAGKAGVSLQEASGSLSALLPQVIDKLTPGGSIPGADQAAELAKKIPGAEGLTDQLSSLLGGRFGSGGTPSA